MRPCIRIHTPRRTPLVYCRWQQLNKAPFKVRPLYPGETILVAINLSSEPFSGEVRGGFRIYRATPAVAP